MSTSADEPGRLTEEQRADALALARAALTQARGHDWSAASSTVEALQDRYGPPGISFLIVALADAVLAHQGIERGGDALVLPVWLDSTQQRCGSADDVPPRVRWAGRFIAARAADDEATAVALLDSLVDDAEFSDRVSALMEITVDTLNELDAVR